MTSTFRLRLDRSAGVGVGISVLLAYLSGVAIMRTIHTLYGKKSGLFL